MEHTAELELEIHAASEGEVFADALGALAELLGGEVSSHASQRTVTVSAQDKPALLAAWLEELVFLAESEGFIASRLDDLELQAGWLRATVTGELGSPRPLVKAVTYHHLTLMPAHHGYVATVVLDV